MRSLGSMRVIVVVLFTMLTTICSVKAQHYHFKDAPKVRTEWGAGVGGVYTGISRITTADVALKPRFGIQGHIDFAVLFGRNFAIETEVAYEGGSIDATAKGLERRVRTRTIDIPVLLSLRLADNIVRISAGTVFSVMSNAEYTVNDEVMFFGPIYPTWNLAGGIAVGLGRHFVLEARYIHALKDNTNQFNGIEFKTRPYKITAGVGITF